MRAFVASEFPFNGRRQGLTSFFLIFFARLNAVGTADRADGANYTDPRPPIRSIRVPVAIRNDVHEKVVLTRAWVRILETASTLLGMTKSHATRVIRDSQMKEIVAARECRAVRGGLRDGDEEDHACEQNYPRQRPRDPTV